MAEPSTRKPPTVIELIWEHDLVFGGKSGDVAITLDSRSHAGPSPMQALAFGLASCMAMDVVHVLKKGRHDLRGMRADLTGQRANAEPRRFTAIALHYTITGNVPTEAVERAVTLSREKYCSVWHSMRQDIELTVTFTVTSGS
ncbi:MAG: OsmC family protein [Acidobacteria bacterium]|nr:OsmC family protein [Acidobacteriota bacterium]MCA1649128.1 OsmC family protein [Acidobacteriota bacterium]